MTTIHAIPSEEILAKIESARASCNGMPALLDEWLRELCAPFVARIDREKAHLWSHSIDVPLRAHDYDPVWLEQFLRRFESLRKNGAAILFAGSDGVSSLIRACTGSRFSHVALGFTTLLQGTHYTPMIWQSYESVPCRADYPRRSGHPHPCTIHGADLSDYAKFIAHYARADPHARYVIRPMRHAFELGEELRYAIEIDHVLNECVRYPRVANLALMYAREQWPRMRALCDFILGPDAPEQVGEYCSALASATLERVRPFLRGRKASDIWPGDFSRDGEGVREVCDARGPLFAREIELRIV